VEGTHLFYLLNHFESQWCHLRGITKWFTAIAGDVQLYDSYHFRSSDGSFGKDGEDQEEGTYCKDDQVKCTNWYYDSRLTIFLWSTKINIQNIWLKSEKVSRIIWTSKNVVHDSSISGASASAYKKNSSMVLPIYSTNRRLSGNGDVKLSQG
jgi:hypothetical protein